MKRFRYLLLISFLLSFPVHTASAADASGVSDGDRALIEKIIAAYGGKDSIEHITGVYAFGDIEAIMRRDSGSYALFFKRQKKLRVETKYQRSYETRILNGDRGYRGTDGAPPALVKDHRLLAMVYQYKHFELVYGLLHNSYAVSRKGKEELNGKLSDVMHLSDNEGPPMDVYVDADTFFIVKVVGYFTVTDGRTTTLSSEFFDFRTVGDTVFPFKVTNYAGGQKIAETRFKIYEINPAMPDSLFEP